MSETTAERADFKEGPLYKTLVKFLPAFTKKPFSDKPELDVQALKDAAGKSHEAVYKWLRSSRLTPENAEDLLKLASSTDNVRVLASLERPGPTIQDFYPFVFNRAG